MNDMRLYDMGNMYLLVIYGFISGIIAFIVTVILEAVIMKKFFPFSIKVRLGYSLVMNLVSVSLGVLYLSFLGI